MNDTRSNYADLGDGIVHYLAAGDGEPVVLLHGIPQTSYEWRHVIPHLVDEFRVIAPDLRGLGDDHARRRATTRRPSRPTSGDSCTII